MRPRRSSAIPSASRKAKNAKNPIVVRPSIKLDAGASSPSHPGKTAATKPSQPIQRETTRVFRIAYA
jgi:hypothetical protein